MNLRKFLAVTLVLLFSAGVFAFQYSGSNTDLISNSISISKARNQVSITDTVNLYELDYSSTTLFESVMIFAENLSTGKVNPAYIYRFDRGFFEMYGEYHWNKVNRYFFIKENSTKVLNLEAPLSNLWLPTSWEGDKYKYYLCAYVSFNAFTPKIGEPPAVGKYTYSCKNLKYTSEKIIKKVKAT